MTEENREYRTSQIMLRNQFHGKDKFKIPIIPLSLIHISEPTRP